jgi:hypothetical protein
MSKMPKNVQDMVDEDFFKLMPDACGSNYREFLTHLRESGVANAMAIDDAHMSDRELECALRSNNLSPMQVFEDDVLQTWLDEYHEQA